LSISLHQVAETERITCCDESSLTSQNIGVNSCVICEQVRVVTQCSSAIAKIERPPTCRRAAVCSIDDRGNGSIERKIRKADIVKCYGICGLQRVGTFRHLWRKHGESSRPCVVGVLGRRRVSPANRRKQSDIWLL